MVLSITDHFKAHKAPDVFDQIGVQENPKVFSLLPGQFDKQLDAGLVDGHCPGSD
jgi:hypothetical protein